MYDPNDLIKSDKPINEIQEKMELVIALEKLNRIYEKGRDDIILDQWFTKEELTKIREILEKYRFSPTIKEISDADEQLVRATLRLLRLKGNSFTVSKEE